MCIGVANKEKTRTSVFMQFYDIDMKRENNKFYSNNN